MNKDMMRQAQQFQTRLAQLDKDLEELIVEGSSGGGVVKVTANGKQQLQNVQISSDAVEDLELLGDLIVAAVNDAVNKVQTESNRRLNSITGGMKIPGLM